MHKIKPGIYQNCADLTFLVSAGAGGIAEGGGRPEQLQVAGVEFPAPGYTADCGLNRRPCPWPSPSSPSSPRSPSAGPAIHPVLIGFGARIRLSRHTLTSNHQP